MSSGHAESLQTADGDSEGAAASSYRSLAEKRFVNFFPRAVNETDPRSVLPFADFGVR